MNLDGTVSLDLKKLFMAGNEDKAVNIGQLYLGILHIKTKCVEIISQDPIPYMRKDGLYSRISIDYDVTQAQFNTLIKNNPLVVLKIIKNQKNKINTYKICGESLLSIGSDEVAEVIAREQILDQSLVNPHLNRFGLSSDVRVNDIPEGVRFIPSNPKRPLLGLADSMQTMMVEPPQCNMDTLRQSLQTAFELEWFKLPLYATSFYTLKPTMENKRVREIMYTVFLQQIVRFGQMGNLLLAAGVNPSMASATSPPKFPSTGLPGNVLQGVYMPLAKFSLEQIASFMKMHQQQATSKVPLINDLFTIETFYDEIKTCIELIGKQMFLKPKEQLTYEIYPGGKIFPVKSADTALDVLERIDDIDGTTQFQQILEEETTFDEDRVYNMVDNPSNSTIFPGTECYDVAKKFNKAVGLIIEKLDYSFNVVGSRGIKDAVEHMKVTGSMVSDVFNVPYGDGAQELICGLVWDMEFQ